MHTICCFRRQWLALLLAVFIAIACMPGIAPGQQGSDRQLLKIALLPVPDALPFFVAQSLGLFEAENVKVKAIPVASGLARDQLMQAGQIDAMLNEMATTAMFNRKKIKVKVLCTARAAMPGTPLFRILAAPGSGLTSVADLAHVPIAVSMNTIIEYITDRLLTREGLDARQIVKKSIPAIPERFQLLMLGRIKAATIPDPLAQSALAAGAVNIIDDAAHSRFSTTVLSFSTSAIAADPDAVRGFLKAWNLAAARINADPDAFRPILLGKIRVPKNIVSTYVIPPFPCNTIPDARQWEDMMQWLVEKGLLDHPLVYADSVTDRFLP